MNIELLTKTDLENFRKQLLQDIAAMLNKKRSAGEREWLKSKEVRQMLSISNTTLANLRVKRLLNPTKIDGTYYYKLSEIQALLNAGDEE